MVTKRALDISAKLATQYYELEVTRRRMESLYIDKKIFKRDIDHVYEGIFLRSVTAFETFIEELFYGLLYHKYKLEGRKRFNRVSFDTRTLTEDIILSGNNYIEWLPFEKTLKKANVFFFQGEPFSIVPNAQRNIIFQIMSIRNAIAHKSASAKEKFNRHVVGNVPGLPEENKTPAGFLRYKFRTDPDQTTFENYHLELASIANNIASHR